MLLRGSLLGLAYGHFVRARWRNISRELPAHRAHISNQLPHLVVGNLPREAGHAVWTALHNVGVNLFWAAAINPLCIHQRRADAAPAVLMTSDTVVCGK